MSSARYVACEFALEKCCENGRGSEQREPDTPSLELARVGRGIIGPTPEKATTIGPYALQVTDETAGPRTNERPEYPSGPRVCRTDVDDGASIRASYCPNAACSRRVPNCSYLELRLPTNGRYRLVYYPVRRYDP